MVSTVTPSAEPQQRLTLRDVQEAQARISGKVRRTPVFTSSTVDARAQSRIFFKCENFQKTGVFKARGAMNAILSLTDDEAARGVVTHSSGNHGAAVAWAAGFRGIPAYVVMPRTAPAAKIASARRYGARITFCDSAAEARERGADEIVASTGATLLHPYDDLRVMAGQGTTGLELMADLADLDAIVCPLGGGGQLSGIAVAVKSANPRIKVIGVEPANADDGARSLRAGYIVPYDGKATIADGLRTSLGQRTFTEIREYVDDVIVVSEAQIVEAMRAIWEIMKIIVEPSAAVAYASVMDPGALSGVQRCAVILTGGNLDLHALPWAKSAE